jgi:aminoglycoside 3-N-acetyltransferase
MPDIITRERLVKDFRASGVEKNDIIMLHSSLKNVGWAENGADTVIDALLEVIGDGGTLAVPTYTYSYIGRESGEAYDRRKTSCINNGVITDMLWRREGARRSSHPTHSIGAIGRLAEYLTSDHPDGAGFGVGSPLHKLAEKGGKILLLGVGQDRNSLIHVGEALAGALYNEVPFREGWGRSAKRITEQNEEEIVPQVEFPGCSYNFGVMEDLLNQKGIVRFGQAGNAVTRIMNAQAVLDQVIEMLRDRPGFLLCDRPECECCTARKRLLEQLENK